MFVAQWLRNFGHIFIIRHLLFKIAWITRFTRNYKNVVYNLIVTNSKINSASYISFYNSVIIEFIAHITHF